MREAGTARATPADELDRLASLVQRLAVLLAAGLPPRSAWAHVAERSETAGAVAAAVAAGSSVPDALAAAVERLPENARGVWSALAAAWTVAAAAGSPLAPALRDLAASLRALAQAERDIRVALAGPAATARLVLTLPGIAILFGFALGFDPVTVLLGNPLGVACLAAGSALMLLARAWTRRLVAAARARSLTPGLGLELTAIALSGGAPAGRAADLAGTAAGTYGLDLDADAVGGILDLSSRAGAPARELLRAEAAEARRLARSEAQQRAAVLGVRLMLPLGLCVLPAFLLLGVAPLVIGILGATLGGVGG